MESRLKVLPVRFDHEDVSLTIPLDTALWLEGEHCDGAASLHEVLVRETTPKVPVDVSCLKQLRVLRTKISKKVIETGSRIPVRKVIALCATRELCVAEQAKSGEKIAATRGVSERPSYKSPPTRGLPSGETDLSADVCGDEGSSPVESIPLHGATLSTQHELWVVASCRVACRDLRFFAEPCVLNSR